MINRETLYNKLDTLLQRVKLDFADNEEMKNHIKLLMQFMKENEINSQEEYDEVETIFKSEEDIIKKYALLLLLNGYCEKQEREQ